MPVPVEGALTDTVQTLGAKAGAVASQAGQAALDAATAAGQVTLDAARQAGQTAVDATNQWGNAAGVALSKAGVAVGPIVDKTADTCGGAFSNTWTDLWNGAVLQAGGDTVSAIGTCAQSAGTALKSFLPFLN